MRTSASKRLPAKRAPSKARLPKGPVWQWSAIQTAAAIGTGAVSAVDITEAHIAHMQAVNPTLNAITVDLSEDALRAARAADKQRKTASRGPLHGVPVTIKQNVDYEGRANTNGVEALNGLIAPSDSPVVRNLKNAGAIILGLTNTPEFSLRAFTDNPMFGLTQNPWSQDITCGGSSGGAGAAVAAGIGAIAHGNDIGGSLRWPAHCNGVVTIKPTQGRVPAFSESASVERPMLANLMSAQGPLARSVADVRLALEVMSQRDPRDPWWVPAPLEGPKPKGPIKVALAKMPDDLNVHPSVTAALRQAADHLERSGYRVSEVELPDLNGVWQIWCDILINEAIVMQEANLLPVTSPDFHMAWNGMRALAKKCDLAAWMSVTTIRNRHIRAWQLFLEDYPVVLTPASVQPTPGPRADAESIARTGEIMRNDLRFISAINVLGLPGAVVPVALHDGIPIGVQLIAGRYREDLALDAAAAIEKRVGMLVRELWSRET
ncbi:amidase family protein [Tardiphaga sp.]|uniref:amidase family protein n=1 Tax=Tardiphaga sp. TaxID=1926292 RepID=UPI0037D9AF16